MKKISLQSIVVILAAIGIAVVTFAQQLPPSNPPSGAQVFPPINTSSVTQRKSFSDSYLELGRDSVKGYFRASDGGSSVSNIYPGIISASTGGFFGPFAALYANSGLNFAAISPSGSQTLGVGESGVYLKTGGTAAANNVLTLVDPSSGRTEWRPGGGQGSSGTPTLTTTTETINSIDMIVVEKSDWLSGSDTNNNASLEVSCPSSHPAAIAVSCLSPSNAGVDECYLTDVIPPTNQVAPVITGGVALPAWDQGIVTNHALGIHNAARMSTQESNDSGWAKLQLTCAKITPVTVIKNVTLNTPPPTPTQIVVNGPITVASSSCWNNNTGVRMDFDVSGVSPLTQDVTYNWRSTNPVNNGFSSDGAAILLPNTTYTVEVTANSISNGSATYSQNFTTRSCP